MNKDMKLTASTVAPLIASSGQSKNEYSANLGKRNERIRNKGTR